MPDRRSGCRALLEALLLGGTLTACGGQQSMLAPHGPEAAAIAQAWWIMFGGALLILLLVMLFALYALYRAPERRRAIHAQRFIGGWGLLFPTVTLTALLVYGLGISLPGRWAEQPVLTVEVTGHRWWWEVRYPNAALVTANEVHIPAGRTVRFVLTSNDVIHSLWVPSLGGKLDMIPGRVNTLLLRADAPGEFRGQCAEFCGGQHARMAFRVHALPEAQFEDWLAQHPTTAAAPTTPAARRGQRQFVEQGCVECHTIRGTTAAGRTGPDLTHVASRRFLAAGTLRNNRHNLEQWIAHNQRIKPGNRMEDFSHLKPEVIADLASYLETLR